MVHNGLDGRVFRVERLECVVCGERAMVAKKESDAFVPPEWRRAAAVEANFGKVLLSRRGLPRPRIRHHVTHRDGYCLSLTYQHTTSRLPRGTPV